MTTSPVLSVTDELVAELEQYSGVPSIAALLTERAELKRDAGRYRLYRQGMAHPEALDTAIDAAMQADN